jgi:eukaryotic-like serine/threonine-protein kinase
MQAGDVIAGRFVVQRVAGEGAMGTVVRCLDRDSGGPAAVKLLGRLTLDHARRFEREAWILSELDHPGIVRYLGHGTTSDGGPFLAMEWLEGEDLSQRFQRERLGIEDVLVLTRQVAEALDHAHRRGIVHRDIKPANLFLVDGDLRRVKLLDFGVARFSQPALDATQFGVTIGTPSYMSPEQARGDATLDTRADIFSLGCVTFEGLVGRPPFVADTLVAILAKILLEDVPRLGELRDDVDPRLDALVARMLAKDPARRIADMPTLVRELARLSDTDAVPELAGPDHSARLTSEEQRLLCVVVTTPAPRVTVSEDLDATLAADPQNEAPSLFSTTISRFGGRVEQLADGSFVAVVRSRSAANDQAGAAATAALALRRALPHVRAAVATGRGVVAGRLPVGEVIDRAVMLLRIDRDASVPATIRLDDTTAALIETRFVVGRDAKGLLLVGERALESGVRTLLGRPTPCVGREMELSLLETLYDTCVSEPRAQAVLVSGPAGMGKSRLYHELLRRLERSDTEALVIVARGNPVGAGSAFGLLAPALHRLFGLQEGEPDEVRQRKLLQRIGLRVPEPKQQRVAEFIGELIGVPFDATQSVQLAAARQDARLMGDQMERAFEDFFAHECEAHPVILVLEDLHWGDRPTVRFVDGALRALADRPLYVLALGRPSVHDTFPGLWAGRDLQVVRLRPLSKRAALELLHQALDRDADPQQLERLAQQAEGNAFYLEELARAVADGRSHTLPDSVLAMVEARLEELGAGERRVLRAASVFGSTFWATGVTALLGGDDAVSDIDEHLQALVDHELVERRRAGRFPGHEELVFRHSLVREAAYAMLSVGDRTLGHRLAAQWLEAAGETDPMVLAAHLLEGQEPARAARWLGRGAELALEGNDFSAATQLVRRGLQSATDDEQRGVLLLLEAEACRWQGQFADAARSARTAASVLPPGSASWYRSFETAVSTESRLDEYEGAVRHHEALLAAAPEPAAAGARATALCATARVLFQGGRYDLAEQLMEEIRIAAEDPERVGPRAMAEVQRLRGARARHVGDVAGDLRWYAASLRAFEEAGDVRQACNARVSVGFSWFEVGDLDRAREELERAREDAARLGLQTVDARARQNLAQVLAAEGRLEEAEVMLDGVLAESLEQNDVRFASWTRIYLANVAFARGACERAVETATAAVDELAASPPARAGALAVLARACAARGEVDAALRASGEALEVLEGLGGLEEFESLIRLARVEALLAVGDRPAATAAVAVARRRVEERAGALPGPQLRSFFASRLPENRRILELAATLAGPAAAS